MNNESRQIRSYVDFQATADDVFKYFRALAKVGPPPRGVSGERKVKAFHFRRNKTFEEAIQKYLASLRAKLMAHLQGVEFTHELMSPEARQNYIEAIVNQRLQETREAIESGNPNFLPDDAIREIRESMANWRCAYAVDTYGGKAYRGSAKLEVENTSGRMRWWSSAKEATAPPTK